MQVWDSSSCSSGSSICSSGSGCGDSTTSSRGSSSGCGDSSCGSITVIWTHTYYICEYEFISMYVFPCYYCYYDRVPATSV